MSPLPRTPAQSIPRHHAEWLSLLDVSGPFLSLEALLSAFPQGLEGDNSEVRQRLRLAWDEWRDNQFGVRAESAVHDAWVRYILGSVLEFPDDRLRFGSALPEGLAVDDPVHGDTIRPDYAIVDKEGSPRLLVLVEPPKQKLDKVRAGARSTSNPTDRLITLLRGREVPLGLVTNGEEWRLVFAPRNAATSLATWYAELWLEEPLTLRAWRSVLGVRRFFGVPDDETIEALFRRSLDAQHDVIDQLGGQVRRAVEQLVQAIDLADRDAGHNLLANVSDATIYRAATTIMMRLVFLFSAEERGSFPLEDELYQSHYAATTLREQLRKAADAFGEEVIERRSDAWHRLLATFRAIHAGVQHDRLRLPAYGGTLFDPDTYPFLEGRPDGSTWTQVAARPLPVNNRVILHVLEALQLLQVKASGGETQTRRLSFRALDVEQIGDVYEGLLDHKAVRASEPVLGLVGTRGKEPELALSLLENRAKTRAGLVEFLREQTGKTARALEKALDAELDLGESGKLWAACDNDEALYERVRPFAGLLRRDDFDRYVVFVRGSVYVTAGSERRATGTHYTPRSLAEPIVQHTLEPLVYSGPAEGFPREEWNLIRAEEILKLKVCDMAMGSGAFLVAVVRYLSERLVEAWGREEAALLQRGRKLWLNQEGTNTRDPNHALPADPDDRLALAKRLVAERCIYGVDKNPEAVELAKLALWLITLDRNRPFTFVDHALKAGDSLVGIHTLDQLRCWNLQGSGERAFGTVGLDLDIAKMVRKRNDIEAQPVRDADDQALKAMILLEADAIGKDLKSAADMLIGSYYNTLNAKQQATLRAALLSVARDGVDLDAKWQPHADLGDLKPFHWPLEFPEVFVAEGRTGFDAFVGNPPFIGGRRIREALGDRYREYIDLAWKDSSGNADYCAFFYLRAFRNLGPQGTFGLLATNTISQGDTRLTGLATIESEHGTIYRAQNNMEWPGNAAVVVDIVHVARGLAGPPYMLDGRPVEFISSQLDDRLTVGEPYVLKANEDKSFQGSVVVGMGFVLEPDEANRLIDKDERNRQVILPYLNGEDLNTSPTQSPSRFVINFFDWPRERTRKGSWFALEEKKQKEVRREGVVPEDYPDPVAADFADVFGIVKERVYPVRQLVNREAHRKYWWHYGDKRPALYSAIMPLERVLTVPQTATYLAISIQTSKVVFSHMLAVFSLDTTQFYTLLNSTLHQVWIEQYSATMGAAPRYFPSDCFVNFPFPPTRIGTDDFTEQYDSLRRMIMLSRWEGLTATYNRFHDAHETSADIAQLRALHVEMDSAVAAAYGWSDLVLGHGFRATPQGERYTISEPARREVLRRLLALNHERYAEEVKAGLHDKKKAKSKKGKGSDTGEEAGQIGMFAR